MAATQDFLAQLREEKKLRNKDGAIGIVGMRVDPRTRAAATLAAHVAGYDLPVLGYLRDTVTYANAAFNGQSIFDLPPYLGTQDAEQWGPIVRWLAE